MAIGSSHISYKGKTILVFVESYQAMKVGGHVYICVIGAGPMRGGSTCTSVRGPESQEGTRESLKPPIALAIDVLF